MPHPSLPPHISKKHFALIDTTLQKELLHLPPMLPPNGAFAWAIVGVREEWGTAGGHAAMVRIPECGIVCPQHPGRLYSDRWIPGNTWVSLSRQPIMADVHQWLLGRGVDVRLRADDADDASEPDMHGRGHPSTQQRAAPMIKPHRPGQQVSVNRTDRQRPEGGQNTPAPQHPGSVSSAEFVEHYRTLMLAAQAFLAGGDHRPPAIKMQLVQLELVLQVGKAYLAAQPPHP